MIGIAIVEDDPGTLARIAAYISRAEDMAVVATASNVKAGRAMIAQGGYDVLLCDLGLPDGNGIDLIRASSQTHPDADIIVITIFAEQAKVLSSIKAGARGYLLKDENLDACAERIREVHGGGSPISPIIARQLLRQLAPAGSAEEGDAALTPRETEVLGLLARGFSYGEIAAILSLSAQTIGTHVKNLYRKLEVRSRSEAVFEASSRGIISMQ
ncbi:MAG TPA: response regulator transcription factor [Chakrabartia sp.]|nr:response regulator transcription factor [Chakrabartia sp.]